ncbi:helix-turn-helix transcriptional regulator [Arsenicicoccus piscis]|nr:helix-turn-helix transcriptional regulator [Arsenicicoccus piscis]
MRELLAGPMRYTDLRKSLGGIATNLLADRLRTMEERGVVERRLVDSGVLYALTPWGLGLREPLEALGRWGAPLLASGPGEDAFQPRWLTLALPALLRGATATPPVELGIEVDGFLIVLRVDEDGPHASVPADTAATDAVPATVLVAAPDVIVALATGALTVEQALAVGHLEGERDVLRTVFGD